jgi:hypothetical protein
VGFFVAVGPGGQERQTEVKKMSVRKIAEAPARDKDKKYVYIFNVFKI